MFYRCAAAALAAAMFGAVTAPAAAQGVVVPLERMVTIDEAREIAGGHGLRVVDSIELNRFNGRWEIDGRDAFGRDIEIDVDANTGAVVNFDRD